MTLDSQSRSLPEEDSVEEKRKLARRLTARLNTLYGEAACTLEFKNPLELLISTMLAAQCTDERVNIVTKTLYQKYTNVSDFAEADALALEKEIRSTGFYHNKAKNIISCCNMLIGKYNGELPKTMDELLKLPGVGRKTANLVLGDAFGVPGVVVDTHAGRLARRMGLTRHKDPEKIEYDLMETLPRASWTRFCHQLVLHGRAVCAARKPRCDACALSDICKKRIIVI